jgi:hypothetical protein
MPQPIDILSDLVLPSTVVAAMGLRGQSMQINGRTRSPSGYVRVNSRSSRTLNQYEFGWIPMLVSEWATMEGVYRATNAGALGFLLEDPKDQTVAATDGVLYPYTTALIGTAGAGYGVPTYKLHKRYTAAGSTRTSDRQITRPKATPALLRAGSPVTLGASPGNAAIDLDTGTVTFVADSSSGVTAFTAGATTDITLSSALSGLAIGGRLYLTGIAGTSATTLNGTSHEITNITGGSLNVYTLDVDTTGLTRTSGGTGYKYPQASETLTWSGSFYVPVHFQSDILTWDMPRVGAYDDRLVRGPSIVLDEVLE